jgi:MFS family permease
MASSRARMALEGKKGYIYLLLITICIAYFVENFLRSAAGALTPILIDELGISHAAMGLLISAYFFVYGLMQIPSGVLSDTFGARKTIISFTAITVVGIIIFQVSRSYHFLFSAQFLIGVGCSTFYINAVKLVSTWFPAERKATAIGILSASSGLGNFVSYMGFPVAVESFGGWRNLYLLMSVILVLNWGMNFFIIKDKEQVSLEMLSENPRSILKSIRKVLVNRAIYPFITGYILASTSWVFMNWMPQFLIDTKGFTYLEVGQIASAGTIAGIPGCIIVAAISDKMRNRKKPLIEFALLYSILLGIFIYLPSTSPLLIFAAISFTLNFAVSFWVLFFSMIPETLPSEIAGIGLGLMNGFGTIGFSLITPIYGGLVDSTGGYAASNLVILGGAILMPLIFVFFIKECYGGAKMDDLLTINNE